MHFHCRVGDDWQYPPRPALLDTDFGTPIGQCQQGPGGQDHWIREWTKATVELDCGSWKANITMK